MNDIRQEWLSPKPGFNPIFILWSLFLTYMSYLSGVNT